MADFTASPCLSVPILETSSSYSPHSPFTNCGALASLIASPFGYAADNMRGTKRKTDDDDADMMSRSPSPGIRTLPSPFDTPGSSHKTPTNRPTRDFSRDRLSAQRRNSPSASREFKPAGSPTLGSHKTKRTRKEVQLAKLPLNKLLEPLNKEQLVVLLGKLAEQDPLIEDAIVQLTPQPTLQTVTAALMAQQKQLYDSFPYTKWGPSTDDYSFRRVRPQLQEFRDSIIQYTHYFTSEEAGLSSTTTTTSFAFLQTATDMALRLPQWDTVENNAIRTQLLGELANAYQRAIRIAAGRLTEGKLYGQQVVEEWGRNLQRHVTESQGQFFKPALDAFLHYFGWLLGSNLSHTVASSATGPVPAYLFSATS